MEQFRACKRKYEKGRIIFKRKFNKCGMLHAIQYVIKLAFSSFRLEWF